jgi:hypothetical protein
MRAASPYPPKGDYRVLTCQCVSLLLAEGGIPPKGGTTYRRRKNCLSIYKGRVSRRGHERRGHMDGARGATTPYLRRKIVFWASQARHKNVPHCGRSLSRKVVCV